MKFLIAAAALALGSAPTSATKVEVAKGDWSSVPMMKGGDFSIVTPDVMDRLHRSFANGECVMPGQSKDKLNLNVPFLIQFDNDGGVHRLVLQKLGCDSVERVLASVLLKQAQLGEYKSARSNPAGWYRSALRISSS